MGRSFLAATEAQHAFHLGLVLTAFGFGFRHGIDWDHIAALTDITGSQDDSRRSMLYSTMYALGHALVVFLLGFAAIVLARQLPPFVDDAMQRFVGFTLLVLGGYVFYSLSRKRRAFRMRSRWMLIFAGVQRATRELRLGRARAVVIEHDHQHAHTNDSHSHPHLARDQAGAAHGRTKTTHRHTHRHLGVQPDDPFTQYGTRSAFLVGMIHGIGAETPTQVLIFLAAAGTGGRAAGLVLLACFLVGLLTANTAIALASTFGFLNASRNFGTYVAISLLTATFSLGVGLIFIFGKATVLPAFFAG